VKKIIATPLKVGALLVVLAAAAAWCPQPLRGLVTIVVGLAVPAWMIGRVARRYLALPIEIGVALGGAVTLALWSLAMLGLLAIGIKLSRPEVLLVTAALVLIPGAALGTWSPHLDLEVDAPSSMP